MPRWLCVASGTSSRIRSTSPSAKPASSSRSAAAPRTRPCAHGHALMPQASTPTTRRTRSGEAAAIPIRRRDLLGRQARSPASGARAGTAPRSAPRRAARAGARRCGARCARRASRRGTPRRSRPASIASPKSSGNRDMCTPFWPGSRSTVHEISAAKVFSWPSCRIRIAFCDAGDAGPRQPELDLGHGGLQVAGPAVLRLAPSGTTVRADGGWPLPPSRLACLPRPADASGDRLRLRADADAAGRARRAHHALPGDDRGGEPSRWRSCSTSSGRRRGSRAGAGSPCCAEAGHARACRERTTSGSSSRATASTVETDVEAVAALVAALAVAAIRHGPVERVTWRVDGRLLELSPGQRRRRARRDRGRAAGSRRRSSRAS